MKLVSAELDYYCQHKRLCVNFTNGLNAIIGRNGSGKSNLIKGIYGTITGDFTRNDGIKADNVSQFAKASDASRVSVVLEHNGSTITIARGIRPTSVRLNIDTGSTPIVLTKATEVHEELMRMLGVSDRMLSDYVFVDQWSIFDFLSMMPSERAKAMQRLFQTERAEYIHKTLGVHRETIAIPRPGVDKDTLLTCIAAAERKYEAELVEFDKLDGSADLSKVESLHQLVNAADARRELERAVTETRMRIEELSAEIQSAEDKVTTVDKEVRTFSAYLQETKTPVIEADRLVSRWSTYELIEQNRKSLVKQRNEATFERDQMIPPILKFDDLCPERNDPKAPAHMVGWWEKYDDNLKRLSVAEHFMSQLSADKPHCPTCGTPRAELNAHRAKYEKEIKELEGWVKKATEHVKYSDIARARQKEWKSCMTASSAKLTQINQQLEKLKPIQPPDKARPELEALIAEYGEVKEAYRKTRAELQSLTQRIGVKKAQLQILEQLANDQSIRLKGLPTLSAVEVDNYKRELATIEKTVRRRAELEAHINVLTESIAAYKQSLVGLDDMLSEARVLTKWQSHVDAMRNVLHRDNLPRIVSQNNLEAMEDEINSLLDRFDSPFSVSADEGLSFMVRFRDGRTIPAGRLSGGEKVLLALAFRVAVNSLFAGDLGLLCLDEPTAGLDEGNLGCLRIALERLKELSNESGLQVIMITHERNLPCFDKVIDLG